MNVLVMDLADLRLSAHDGHIQVRTANLVTLTSVPDDPRLPDEERAFSAYDAVLERARVLTDAGELVPVALYNPLTGQVAVGPVPFTEVFSDDRPLQLPTTGQVMRLAGNGLCAAERVLPRLTPSVASVLAAVAAGDPMLVR